MKFETRNTFCLSYFLHLQVLWVLEWLSIKYASSKYQTCLFENCFFFVATQNIAWILRLYFICSINYILFVFYYMTHEFATIIGVWYVSLINTVLCQILVYDNRLEINPVWKVNYCSRFSLCAFTYSSAYIKKCILYYPQRMYL